MSAKCWLYSQQLSVAVDSVRAGVGTVASSESGLRFAALAPQLLAAKDLTELVEVMAREAEFNWNLFFDKIGVSSYRASLVDTLTDYSLAAYQAAQTQAGPGSPLPILLNGFLSSYKLPAFDGDKPAKSVTAILNKSIRLFTTHKLDTGPYIDQVADLLSQLAQESLNGRKFSKLSTRHQTQHQCCSGERLKAHQYASLIT